MMIMRSLARKASSRMTIAESRIFRTRTSLCMSVKLGKSYHFERSQSVLVLLEES